MISNLADLRAVVSDEFHNSALAQNFSTFLDQAHQEIARWAVADVLDLLVEDTDTNDVLVMFPEAYRYGVLSRGCSYARDYEAAQIYEAQFQAQLRRIGNSTLALPTGLAPSPSTFCTP